MPTKPLSDEDLRLTVETVAQHKTHAEAARVLGIDRRTIPHRLAIAARRGIAPGHFEHGVAPGYLMGKVTISRNKEGVVDRTWERQEPDKQMALAMLKTAIDSLLEAVPARKKTQVPKLCRSDLLTQYTFTDYHMNMLAWSGEGGADWNIDIATKTALAAMDFLVEGSPASDTAVINIMGDWQHYDSMDPKTPTSGHIVDSAGRPGQGLDASIMVIEELVQLALRKHKNVILLICEGNHDIYTSMVIRKLFKRLYRNEPRIQVPDRDLPFYAVEWGKVALFYHHGHMTKWAKLPMIFADLFDAMWGRTKKRYGNTGHYHHEKREEFNGIKMMQHPTMAANDAHGSRHGYNSHREMSAMTFHKEFGKGSELIVTPEMLGI